MYCTVEEIKSAILAYNFFKKHSLPDDEQLTAVGETVAKEIDGYLLLYGYSLPVNDANLLNFLSSLNVDGAVAFVIANAVPNDVRPDNVSEKRYEMGINLLKDRHYINMGDVKFKADDNVW